MAFELGKTLHLIHIVDDYEEAAAWYADVFNGLADWIKFDGFPYLDVEIRDADLIIIGDCCVEPMAPAKRVEGWDQKPVGRFLNKFGQRWQTMSWYTTELPDVYERLKKRGTRFFMLGGGAGDEGVGDNMAVFTHPRDTYGGLEFASYAEGTNPPRPRLNDPRYLPGFDPGWWARNHPLTIERLGHMTVVVDDLDGATEFYTEGLGATVLEKNTSELTATENVYLAVGTDTVVELARPTGDSSLAARDLASNGAIFHAVTWKVRDLESARAHLEAKKVGILGSDEHTIVTDPETTYGAVHRFTTWKPKGDPRD